MTTQQTQTLLSAAEVEQLYPRRAFGKVREIYDIDQHTLLFCATDRVSAFDVVLDNGIPQKGAMLTVMSAFWFDVLTARIPNLQTHFITLDLPAKLASSSLAPSFRNRCMQVRRLKVFPIESIVRGYITGSAWSSYRKTGTVNDLEMPQGLQESQKFPAPLWTPSTKAELGDKDENISPEQAAKIVGEKYAKQIEELSLAIYAAARDFAAERGIIIADTKFEFALDEATDTVVLVDEVLTPDSSRFWPAESYKLGASQPSLDKQYLRDWLISSGLKGQSGVSMPTDVVEHTFNGYREAFERLTGKKWVQVSVSGLPS